MIKTRSIVKIENRWNFLLYMGSRTHNPGTTSYRCNMKYTRGNLQAEK